MIVFPGDRKAIVFTSIARILWPTQLVIMLGYARIIEFWPCQQGNTFQGIKVTYYLTENHRLIFNSLFLLGF